MACLLRINCSQMDSKQRYGGHAMQFPDNTIIFLSEIVDMLDFPPASFSGLVSSKIFFCPYARRVFAVTLLKKMGYLRTYLPKSRNYLQQLRIEGQFKYFSYFTFNPFRETKTVRYLFRFRGNFS